jgi:hypothetical protein
MHGIWRACSRAAVGAAVAAIVAGTMPAGAENLGMLFGPRYSTDNLGGIHFDQRIRGGGSFEAELGVHALRHRQDLQARDRPLAEPYSSRYRAPADRHGRSAWPNGEPTLRGGPTYEGDLSTCHPVDKVDLDSDGNRRIFSGTRCYDGYGEPHVLERSYRQREYR